MMNFDALVLSFRTGTYTGARRAEAQLLDGRAQPPTETPISIVAACFPASGKDRELLPEGARVSEARVIFSVAELKVGGDGSGYLPDRLVIDGATYEVKLSERWAGAFYRAIGTLV